MSPTHEVSGTALFDKMVDSVACYERDGTIVYANHVASGILARTTTEGLHPVFERVARSGETECFESFHASRHRWYENHVYLTGDRIWVVGRDITDQKLANARLEILASATRTFAALASDEQLRFDPIARHIAEVIHDGCVIRVLAADGQTFEAPAGVWDREAAVRDVLKQAPAIRAIEGAGEEILRTGRPVIMASVDPRIVADRIAPPDGRYLVIELGMHSVMVVPLKAQGRILGLVSVFRRQAGSPEPYSEADLRLLQELADRAALVVGNWRTFQLVGHSQRRLRLIGDSLPALVSLVDRDERYQFVNATYEKWFGQPRSAFLGRTILDVMGPAAYAAVRSHIAAVLAGQTVSFEARIPYLTGGERDVHATYTPYVVDGCVEGYVALVSDVTDRVRMEDELKAAITVRDEFLGIASHELRTPLTTLGLQLDGLQRLLDTERPALDRLRRKVEIAARQSNRLTSLVDGLVNVARLGTGAFRLERESLDLAALVQEVVERFADEAARIGSPLEVRASEPVLGRWDRTWIDHAFTNLMANALKYGRGKPVEVDVESPRSHALIRVRDRGIGISADDLKRIFDRFERAVPSRHYGGLGLGLYITRQIVEAHGGSVAAESQPGQGSIFAIRLPYGVERQS